MNVQHFFDKETSTLTYIVYDQNTKDAIIIDPVLDYDAASGFIESHSLQLLLVFIKEHSLIPHFCLETHAHADHLSSSNYLKKHFPSIKVAIGENICVVQKTFKEILSLNSDFPVDGRQFDKLIKDNEEFFAGSIKVKAIATPGHTPACMTFLIAGKLFTGDALFIEDSGTGRCDFPNGSAASLYQSIHKKLYKFPDETEVFVGHDYQPNARALRFMTTIGLSKMSNTQLRSETKIEEYINFREARDKTLKAPRLLFPSIQVNIDAGQLPKDAGGKSFLKMPLFDKT